MAGLAITITGGSTWAVAKDTVEGTPARAARDAFAGGRKGFWIDNDIRTWFQDEACAVPFTSSGQVVRGILDKSPNRAVVRSSADSAPIGRWDDDLKRWYLDFASGKFISVPCSTPTLPRTFVLSGRVGVASTTQYLMRGMKDGGTVSAFQPGSFSMTQGAGGGRILTIVHAATNTLNSEQTDKVTGSDFSAAFTYDVGITNRGIIRVDAEEKLNAIAAMTGSDTADHFRIGNNHTLSQPFNGRIYTCFFVAGAVLAGAELTALEDVAAKRRGQLIV